MTTVANNTHSLTELDNVGNGAEELIVLTRPYNATVTIKGTTPILFHAWDIELIEEKAQARKNSIGKQGDVLESYVYRCEDGTIGIPGTYLVSAVTDKKNGAAKYIKDPRSPRKSALDLYKAGLVPLTLIASLGKTDWDYVDRRRVVIQMAGITRSRPAFHAGWEATFELMVLSPDYISPQLLLHMLQEAGRLVGLGDFRPTFGRFQVTKFETDIE